MRRSFSGGAKHIGIMTGHYIGTKAGKTAEVLGGIFMIAIGAKILAEHTGYFSWFFSENIS